MKYLLLIYVFIIVFFIGCDTDTREYTYERDYKYKIVIIDSCEYLQSMTVYRYFVYTHKGNCKNPIHYAQCCNCINKSDSLYRFIKVPVKAKLDSAIIRFK